MRPADLKRYKDQLTEMRSRLDSTIDQSIVAVAAGAQLPGEDESIGAEAIDTETAVERTEAGLLHDVQAALDRIEEGTFGRCTRCGDTIPIKRLEALPYTAYCIDCERHQEQGV